MLGRNRSFDYFENFIELTRICSDSAILLNDILSEYDSTKLKDATENMHLLEIEADNIKYAIVNRLVIEFMPPIEREDILNLTRDLDKVVDNIEDIVLGLYMFRVRDLIPEIFEFSNLIETGSSRLLELVVEFENFKRSKSIKEKVRSINEVEEKGDELYVNAMRNLYDYTRPFDARTIITWTRLLDRLERTVDSIEVVANNIESIVLKNK